MEADIVVKSVMIGLAFASVVTWTVWFAKSIELWAAKRRVRSALRKLATANSIAEAASLIDAKRGAVPAMIRAAIAETRASWDVADKYAIKDRVSARLDRIELAAGRDINRGTGVLATIGSTAPFVGLFGTVWGIMNSFIGISEAQTTNLAIVAPGIAEALLATAIGLVAAIPAVIIYNHFARAIGGYKALIGDAVRRRPGPSVTRLRSRRAARAARGGVGVGHGQSPAGRRRHLGNARDQRHAVHRRDARAAHHLHGGGAAVDGGRAGRAAGVGGAARRPSPTSRCT